MKKAPTLMVASTMAMLGSYASAQNITCGETYTVRSGDFLSSIANRAYGKKENFNLIYSANAEIIGSNPGLIKIGQQLFVPCVGGPVTASTADSSVIRRVKTTEALPGPAVDRPIRVLTATDWVPFTNEDQAQGGLLTEVVNLALAAADGTPEYQIDFVNDWSAHLSPLLTDHAYDFSIGWTQPNCEIVDQLNDDSQFRCNNFNWTEPLYQQTVGYYTLSTMPTHTEHAAFEGMTICRPEGYSTAMLEEVGLTLEKISLVRPVDPAACMEAVLSGDADVALIATDVAEGIFADPSIAAKVRLHDELSYLSALRALIAKTHPRSEELVETINSGLQSIKDSGVWFETVRRHMTAHREAAAASS